MKNQEINEYLAFNLFNKKLVWDKTMCDVCGQMCYNGNKEKTTICEDCGNEVNHRIDNTDYITNWQAVVDKLIKCEQQSLTITKNIGLGCGWLANINRPNYANVTASGDTIGLAVCRAAVEYLKAQESEGAI